MNLDKDRKLEIVEEALSEKIERDVISFLTEYLETMKGIKSELEDDLVYQNHLDIPNVHSVMMEFVKSFNDDVRDLDEEINLYRITYDEEYDKEIIREKFEDLVEEVGFIDVSEGKSKDRVSTKDMKEIEFDDGKYNNKVLDGIVIGIIKMARRNQVESMDSMITTNEIIEGLEDMYDVHYSSSTFKNVVRSNVRYCKDIGVIRKMGIGKYTFGDLENIPDDIRIETKILEDDYDVDNMVKEYEDSIMGSIE